MADESQRFEDTMDALEARREEIEARFHTRLETLSGSIDTLRSAITTVTERRRTLVESRRQALAAVEPALDAASGGGTAWPEPGGGVRGFADRVARWLCRDFLVVLDRRQAIATARLDALKFRVDRLQGTVAADAELTDALEATLTRAHEALHAVLQAHAEALSLINAKDAEVLQRAIAGPMRRMELLFDEFGRQQEALLSQLVGRRAELDELVRAVTPASEDEM